MATPSIQTLITQAQQVLNLQSSNEIRATLAAVLANANVGTPLNPNLTTQQLWNEFGEIVRQSTDDIMSIITDQMMRMVFSPPAPGGAGADKQVIFNDMGVLAGDAGLMYNKATDALTITGDLNVSGDGAFIGIGRVGLQRPFIPTGQNGTTTLDYRWYSTGTTYVTGARIRASSEAAWSSVSAPTRLMFETVPSGAVALSERYRISGDGLHTWSNVNNVGGTQMTLDGTGLGIGASPAAKLQVTDTSVAAATALVRFVGQSSYNLDIQSVNNSVSTVGNRFNFNIGSAGGEFSFSNSGGTIMYLDASGNLLVGATAQTSNEMLRVNSVTSTTWAVAMTSVNRGWLNRQSDAAGGIAALFEVGASNTNVGSITTTAVATAYNIASDYRLKESVQPLAGGLARISALKPSIYKWKVNGSNGEGFLAHELADVVPAAVTGEKDAVDADGKPTYQGVDLSKIVPILVAAIQELTARVQTLEAR